MMDMALVPPGTVLMEVWSDYADPLCYLGLPELLRLHEVPGVRLAWHPFELHPHPAPLPDPDSYAAEQYWERKVLPVTQARRHRLRRPAFAIRSRLAAEAAEHARAEGRFEAMHARLFEAYFRHGRDISNLQVVQDVAVAAGVDAHRLRQAIELGRHTGQVLRSQRRAAGLGVASVPAIAVSSAGGQQLVAGSHPFEALVRVVEAAQK